MHYNSKPINPIRRRWVKMIEADKESIERYISWYVVCCKEVEAKIRFRGLKL